MIGLDTDSEKYLATTAALLDAEKMTAAANLVKQSIANVVETGYDNWNGGTRIWTIYLQVNATLFAEIGSKLPVIEEQINNKLKLVLQSQTEDWFSATVVPKIEAPKEWRETELDVPVEVRKNIFDGLRIEKVAWSGRLSEAEFLERIFDLESIPSNDPRFENVAGDIWQHRVNNPEDWEDDWVYSDSRFDLLRCPSDKFLRFLCEVVHPVVRPDRNQALKLVQHFNDQLSSTGWILLEEEKIAGRPRYLSKRISSTTMRSITRAEAVADALDAGWMQKEIERLENAIDRDPALAIGTAKDLIETCCKTILTKRNVPYSRSIDLPEITKLLTRELRLVPENIADQAKGVEKIRLILRNLSALTQYLAELRGLYGSGHGRDGKHRGLEARHARLAVGAAVTFIDFVTSTHHNRGNP
jgi:AbiJ N-terminal domain 3/Abortive infection C-terminus